MKTYAEIGEIYNELLNGSFFFDIPAVQKAIALDREQSSKIEKLTGDKYIQVESLIVHMTNEWTATGMYVGFLLSEILREEGGAA